ncbi:indole-3-glycerol phosphate synthase TrpC [Staphylococcus americanisciuri]|uniref:Indole-3-glycerol phosphate synthase n=1 Tax=Staphylococcus americanisciuri TaxID=2973940 RepID=A0ABT2F1L1_9STAP|nr:indole-3-glycerol phosphate synthase TrpC [Staphylococcus americanisciuri]MCS4486161.1 indole-3-glycerol phosphate synthase TrpC [Staphylococcus americanisciuri]
MTILDDIVAYKHMLLQSGYYDALLDELPAVNVTHKQALQTIIAQDNRIGVIAEVKSKSPSVSDIPVRDLEAQVIEYTQAGASAISILTDEKYFGGSFERLVNLTQHTSLPVLCKDFIIHKKQIDVAHRAGASLILLIVNILSDDELQVLHDYANYKGLEVLVEVHDEEELERALEINPTFIGVNNRDLRTFKTNVQHTLDMLKTRVPGIHYISESGIRTAEDVTKLVTSGIDGILVGETLMKSDDVSSTLTQLRVYKEAR